MISTLLLAPKVRDVARDYFARLNAGEFEERDVDELVEGATH
jgi:hypothetical protein